MAWVMKMNGKIWLTTFENGFHGHGSGGLTSGTAELWSQMGQPAAKLV